MRRAVVETELPSTVRITVTEWEPVLEVRRGSTSMLVAAGGATVDRSSVRADAVPAVPVLLDDRVSSGDPLPVDDSLVRLLPAIAAGFPDAVGCAVADYRWQSDGRLVIDSACRWSAVLGRAATPTDVAGIPTQIAALAALRGRLNFTRPDFGYVDLEDPAAPAVGGSPGQARPAPVASAAAPAPPPATAPPPARPAPAAAPAHTPSPTPVPTPTPRPAPTPYRFSVGPPRR